MTTKTCTKCKIEKLLECFCKNKNAKDGFNWRCKECSNSAKHEWYGDNADHCRKYAKEYVEKNPPLRDDRARKNACKRTKKYHQKKMNDIEYRAKRIADATFRKHYKKQRTPPWLTKKQKKEMQFFYLFAQSIKGIHGLEYHVDHIHPLQGENFSGLHVPWNLQILSQRENCSKRNTLNVE